MSTRTVSASISGFTPTPSVGAYESIAVDIGATDRWEGAGAQPMAIAGSTQKGAQGASETQLHFRSRLEGCSFARASGSRHEEQELNKFHHSIPILRRPYIQRDEARKHVAEANRQMDEARKHISEANRQRDEAINDLTFARKQADDAINELRNGRITYSIEAEDILVERFFDQIFKRGSEYSGFYVDIGAADPIQWSNTYALHKKGWRGINIEPNPEAAARFAQLRPDDINLTVAVGEDGERATYVRFENPRLNLILPLNQKAHESPAHRIVDLTEIPLRSVNSILSEHVPQGVFVDFMNIDVELMELRILSSLDFSRWSPAVIAVEIHGGLDIDEISKSAVAFLLRTKGYTFISRLWHTSLFVRAT